MIVRGKGGKIRRVPLGKRVQIAVSDFPPVQSDGLPSQWTYHQAKRWMSPAF